MRYDWIFFDLDNTLMDFTEASKLAFSSAFQTLGLREEEGHYAIYENYNHQVWLDFEENRIDGITLRRKRFDDFMLAVGIKGIGGLEFNRIYLEFLVEHSFMLDGAIPLLDDLKKNFSLAIITNGFKEVQRPRLDRLKITDYFSAIVVSDEIGVSKPDAAFFDIAMSACSFPSKDRILVVGDSLNSDMKGGVNYGLDTCWCNLKKLPNHSDILPMYEIHRLDQLHELLD